MMKKFHTGKSLVTICFARYKEFTMLSDLSAPRANHITLVCFKKGAGTVTIDLEDCPVKAGQLHILLPGKIYNWQLNTNISAAILTISKNLLENFPPFFQFIFSQNNRNQVLDLDEPTFKKIFNEFLAIREELSSIFISQDLLNARCLLITLIISLWKPGERSDIISPNVNSIAQAFQALVEENFKKHKTVTYYADRLCITPNYLGIICRKNFQMSALEIISRRVLQEAKQLLQSPGKSIKEIAFELGFPNLTYFSYFFKSKTNLTPAEYRRLMERSLKLNFES